MFSSLFSVTVYALIYTGVIVDHQSAQAIVLPVSSPHVIERFASLDECERIKKELLGSEFLSWTKKPHLRCYEMKVSIFK